VPNFNIPQLVTVPSDLPRYAPLGYKMTKDDLRVRIGCVSIYRCLLASPHGMLTALTFGHVVSLCLRCSTILYEVRRIHQPPDRFGDGPARIGIVSRSFPVPVFFDKKLAGCHWCGYASQNAPCPLEVSDMDVCALYRGRYGIIITGQYQYQNIRISDRVMAQCAVIIITGQYKYHNIGTSDRGMTQCGIIILCALTCGDVVRRGGATYVDSAMTSFTSLPYLFLRTEYFKEAV
jgi:hypothetical protein